MSLQHRPSRARPALLAAAVALTVAAGADPASAASSKGCEGGGFAITQLDGAAIAQPATAGGSLQTTIPADRLGTAFLVSGRYVRFTVVAATFGVEDWTLTGAPNPLDVTGGVPTVVFASKTPDHRGLTLTSGVAADIAGPDLVISRTGPGLGMKLQAKDCANGGVFQTEPQRADGTSTRFVHTLPAGVFYFDNPNFRAVEGDALPFKTTTVVVTPRVNFANDISPNFVGRDSPQVATRVSEETCPNQIAKRDGTFAIVKHCGGVSRWDVASGGRMGQVMGEDATEVSPPATACTQNCQAQNRVRGQAVVLGFPFPVPAASRLQPRVP